MTVKGLSDRCMNTAPLRLKHEGHEGSIESGVRYPLPADYKGVSLDCACRSDLIVEQKIVVEVKRVNELARVHEAAPLNYMSSAGVPTGLLTSFN